MLNIGAHNGAVKFYFLMAASYFFAEYQKCALCRVALRYLRCAMACGVKNMYMYGNKPRKMQSKL
jgi:hypothetical protein